MKRMSFLAYLVLVLALGFVVKGFASEETSQTAQEKKTELESVLDLYLKAEESGDVEETERLKKILLNQSEGLIEQAKKEGQERKKKEGTDE